MRKYGKMLLIIMAMALGAVVPLVAGSFETDAAAKTIADWISAKAYTASNRLYTSADFNPLSALSNALTVWTNGNYIQLLRSEILARRGYSFKQAAFRELYSSISWYTVNSAYNVTNLTANERENLDRLAKIEKENYPIDYWDEVTGPALEVIRVSIGADELKREGKGYFVRFVWPMGVGLKNVTVEWETNLNSIELVKELSREALQKQIASDQSLLIAQSNKQERMDQYKNETRKIYDERLSEASNTLKQMEEADKKGLPIIPQGTVIYNTTGKKVEMKIMSYARPVYIGVSAPSDNTEEGQQALSAYDATMFGGMSYCASNYVQLGTPFGSAFFNVEKGYLEYVYMAMGNESYVLNSDGTRKYGISRYFSSKLRKGIFRFNFYDNDQEIASVLFSKNQFGELQYVTNYGIPTNQIWMKEFKLLPDLIMEATELMHYDVNTGLSWGVNVDSQFPYYHFSIYSNFNWKYGYRMERVGKVVSNLVCLKNESGIKLIANSTRIGNIFNVNGNSYLCDIIINDKNKKVIYLNIGLVDELLGNIKNNNWLWDNLNKNYSLSMKGTISYQGVLSAVGKPYSYDWEQEAILKPQQWIDIYPLESNSKIRRINVDELSIGDIVLKYLQKNYTIGKMTNWILINSLRYLGDDRTGLIYFEISCNIDRYQYAPLIMAIDCNGSLKLLIRGWNASNDKVAILSGAKMGPTFYDNRMIILPEGGLLTVWNSSKGVGVGEITFMGK